MKFRNWLGLALVAVLCLFAAAPAKAQWLRAESTNFVVFSEEPEARLRERILLLENFDRLLRRMTNVDGPPAPNKLPVYIVGGARDLRIIRAGNMSGFYVATSSGIAAFVDGTVETNERGVGRNRTTSENEVLFHEYAHHFMMQYAANAYPHWYVEGFAEYFSTAQFREGSVDVGNFSTNRALWLASGHWLPTERVLFRGRERFTSDQLAMFYAQSWLLTYHFYSTPERETALLRYLQAAREGDPAEAFRNATGMTPDQLHRELRGYVHGERISYLRLPLSDPQAAPQVTISRLPASANDLLLYEASLRVGVPDEYRTTHLAAVRAAAARHGEDAYARRVRALAEILLGDRAAAAPLLDALLASAPGDADLMYLKGLMHLGNSENAEDGEAGEAEATEARRWFTRAHNVDGNHFQTLYRFAQSLRYDRRYGSENTANVLLLAHQLAPQVAEITFNAAALMIARRDFEAAELLLLPLASDPHNTAMAESAQQLLDRARADAAGGSEPAEAPAHDAGE